MDDCGQIGDCMGGGGTPQNWTPTTPPTNRWMEAPLRGGGGVLGGAIGGGGGGESRWGNLGWGGVDYLLLPCFEALEWATLRILRNCQNYILGNV